jgi:HEAT repeat protein
MEMSNPNADELLKWADSIVFEILSLKEKIEDNEEVGLELVRLGIARDPDEARGMVSMTIEGYWRVEHKRQGNSSSSNFEDDPIFLASIRWFRKRLGVEKFLDEMTTAELIPLLTDDNGTVKISVINSLAVSDDQEVATSNLIPLLEHQDSFVRFTTFHALIQLKYPGILEFAQQQLRNPLHKNIPQPEISDNTLIRPAIKAIEELGSVEQQELILEHAFHPHTAIRLCVIEALKNLKHPKAVGTLRKLLKDKRDTHGRPKEVIAYMGPPERVCDEARTALETLGYKLTFLENLQTRRSWATAMRGNR